MGRLCPIIYKLFDRVLHEWLVSGSRDVTVNLFIGISGMGDCVTVTCRP